MKKKNLIILLIIPFIISLLGIISINVSINTFYGDITAIKWEYGDEEAFRLSDSKYILKATPLNSSNAPLDEGNGLIWTCENVDEEIVDPIAEIVYENSNYYLKTNDIGQVIIKCSNLKGNIFRKMTATIYNEGAILIGPVISSSQNNIDDTIYYGQYDLENGNKVNAEIELNVSFIPSDIEDDVSVLEKTDNITIDIANKKILINSTGDAYFKVGVEGVEQIIPATMNFNIVKDGVNVYSYDDLLHCTNKSETGEIVVLRKSFESLDAYKDLGNDNNVELFGNYNQSNDSFNFDNEVYRFETTYNQEYIKQWNEFIKTDSRYRSISNEVLAGLRVQKDFYGNGYTINMHNLTYPSQVYQPDETSLAIPTLGLNDLYRGPLHYYTLGDPNGLPLVTAYGQDNVGMYVDGDNILINDVNLKNCELKGSLSFLETVGTVMEVNGNNNTIRNSRLSNGKNVLRCYSTENFVLDNSLLSNSMNFLLEAGSDEWMPFDETKKFVFTNSNGETKTTTLKDYFDTVGEDGDDDLEKYLRGNYSNADNMRDSLKSIQKAFNNQESIENIYKGNLTIKDTYFYNSGISAIVLQTLFNGPFLYSAAPSYVTRTLSSIQEGKSIIPYTPTNVSGVSYPVQVNLVGKTRFYDYKDTSKLDISGLINENISTILGEVSSGSNITIDSIFPVKPMLLDSAKKINCVYHNNNTEYINVPIAYYGGGLNLSTVNFDELENKEEIGEMIELDFLNKYLTSSTSGLSGVLLKCVTIVTGFEAFKFNCIKGNGYLFNEYPNVEDLEKNAKGV